MALGKMRRERQGFVPPKLQITSMMDMFTIILIFLLFSFSDNPETISIDKDVQLPKSTAKMDYSDNIRITLSQQSVKIGDEVVASIENGRVVGIDADKPEESLLFKKLKKLEERTPTEKVKTGNSRHILFFCDRRLSFKTINGIIKTAGSAGYPNFQFAVLKQ